MSITKLKTFTILLVFTGSVMIGCNRNSCPNYGGNTQEQSTNGKVKKGKKSKNKTKLFPKKMRRR